MELDKGRFTVVIALVVTASLYALVGGKLMRGPAPQSIPQSPAQMPDGPVYLVVNKNSGRCLGIENGSQTAGAKAVQGSLRAQPQAHEQWVVQQVGLGHRLINRHTRYTLEICGAQPAKGAVAGQGPDRGDAQYQTWALEPVGDGFLLRAMHSGLVLGIGQGSRAAGAVALQWDRVEGVDDQVWLLVPTTP